MSALWSIVVFVVEMAHVYGHTQQQNETERFVLL